MINVSSAAMGVGTEKSSQRCDEQPKETMRRLSGNKSEKRIGHSSQSAGQGAVGGYHSIGQFTPRRREFLSSNGKTGQVHLPALRSVFRFFLISRKPDFGLHKQRRR